MQPRPLTEHQPTRVGTEQAIPPDAIAQAQHDRLAALEARHSELQAAQRLTFHNLEHLAHAHDLAGKRLAKATADVDRLKGQLDDLREVAHRRDVDLSDAWTKLVRTRYDGAES